jgi:hypothetical protein
MLVATIGDAETVTAKELNSNISKYRPYTLSERYLKTRQSAIKTRIFKRRDFLKVESHKPHSRRRDKLSNSFRKEVIQPQVLLQLPCYDFTPIMNHTVDACLLAVSSTSSSTAHFRDVTGGVYKTRERIHRSMLICDY